jgi:hypothetical protein
MVLQGCDLSVFYDIFEIDVDRSRIAMAFARTNLARKKLKVAASQQNNELRIDWQDQLQYYTADHFIFIDKSSSDDRSGEQSYGYSEINVAAKVHRWLASNEPISVFAGYLLEGYIAAVTFPGTCTGEILTE